MHEIISIVESIEDKDTGMLSFLDFSSLPWIPQRIYWLQEFQNGASRGHHAHKKLSQVFVLVRGTLSLDIYAGLKKVTVKMNKNSSQVLLQPGLWRVIRDASPDAVLLVLADAPYDEDDYIRDWEAYLTWCEEIKHES
jgi:hypothetical protein